MAAEGAPQLLEVNSEVTAVYAAELTDSAAHFEEIGAASEQLPAEWRALEVRTKRFYIFLACVVLTVLPFSLTYPLQFDLNYEVVCRSLGLARDVCDSSEAANSTVAKVMSVSILIQAIGKLAAIPLVTALMERLGFRFIFLWSLFWLGSSIIMMYFVAFAMPAHWTYWRLLLPVPTVLIGGGDEVYFNTLFIVTTVLFPESELRLKYTNLVSGMFGIVGFFGPIMAGYISQRYGDTPLAALFGIILVCGCAFTFVCLSLPPTPTQQRCQAISAEDAGPSTHTYWSDKVVELKHDITKQLKSIKLLAFNKLTDISARRTAQILMANKISRGELDVGGNDSVILYGKQFYAWKSIDVGAVYSVSSIGIVFWSLIGIPALYKWLMRFFKPNSAGLDQIDFRLICWSTAIKIIGYGGLALAQNKVQYMTALVIRSQSALAGTVFSTALIKYIPREDYSSFATAQSVVDSFFAMVIPPLLLSIYRLTLSSWPTFMFDFESAINIALLLSIILMTKVTPGQVDSA